MKLNIIHIVAVAINLGALPNALFAQHGHLNAGATGTSQDDPLIFANGSDFDESSGYVKTLNPATEGKYAGYYEGNITFTALPTTALNGGPDPEAPAPGAFIVVEFQSVSGPVEGEFSFWEAEATEPTFTIGSGHSAAHRWNLSESDASPGSDPFGHVHGRRFTATKPGIYRVTFQLFDVSMHGANGGPIHTPSTLFVVTFQAGVNIDTIEPDDDHTHIRFAAPSGKTWQVEATTAIGNTAVWQSIGDAVVGDDLFHVVEDNTPVQQNRYYRVSDQALE